MKRIRIRADQIETDPNGSGSEILVKLNVHEYEFRVRVLCAAQTTRHHAEAMLLSHKGTAYIQLSRYNDKMLVCYFGIDQPDMRFFGRISGR